MSARTSKSILREEDREQLLRAVRRAAPWLVASVVFVLISIPAVFDLHGLLIGLALIAGVLGLATAVFTWFDKPAL